MFHRRFKAALDCGCNFAAVRLPSSGDVYFFYAMRDPAMRRVQFQQHDRPVFYCSPYGAADKAYMLVSDAVYLNDECLFGSMPETAAGHSWWHQPEKTGNGYADEAFYASYVRQIIGKIHEDEFDKVVAARCEKLELDSLPDVAALFEKACARYPDACVYFFSTRDAGTWLGASPEQLVSLNGSTLQTTALAGTLAADEPDSWTGKEYDEQAMISFFISNIFEKYALKNLESNEVSTRIAGNVKHLHTAFRAEAPPAFLETKFHKLLGELNPTPAVCGLPQFEASLFISQHESMERRFYSGFNGIQWPDGNLSLYVNLRCAEIFKTHIHLYAGAGITGSSIPEKEWEETIRKIRTIRSLFIG